MTKEEVRCSYDCNSETSDGYCRTTGCINLNYQQNQISYVMREQVTKHSKKPECAYTMLEDMFPTANKLEMFARNTRPTWDSWGNEIK